MDFACVTILQTTYPMQSLLALPEDRLAITCGLSHSISIYRAAHQTPDQSYSTGNHNSIHFLRHQNGTFFTQNNDSLLITNHNHSKAHLLTKNILKSKTLFLNQHSIVYLGSDKLVSLAKLTKDAVQNQQVQSVVQYRTTPSCYLPRTDTVPVTLTSDQAFVYRSTRNSISVLDLDSGDSFTDFKVNLCSSESQINSLQTLGTNLIVALTDMNIWTFDRRVGRTVANTQLDKPGPYLKKQGTQLLYSRTNKIFSYDMRMQVDSPCYELNCHPALVQTPEFKILYWDMAPDCNPSYIYALADNPYRQCLVYQAS